VSNAVLTSWLLELRERDVPRDEINRRVREHLLASGVPETELPGRAATDRLRTSPTGRETEEPHGQ